ncbi:hypothetical protein [Clostridium saccharoperbutylacetonicum]
MIIDNLREISLTSTSKGMLYKCIGNVDGKKVFIKTGTKLKNKFSILEPISEVIASEIIKKFNKYLSEHRIECIKYLLKIRYNHLVERGILC